MKLSSFNNKKVLVKEFKFAGSGCQMSKGGEHDLHFTSGPKSGLRLTFSESEVQQIISHLQSALESKGMRAAG